MTSRAPRARRAPRTSRTCPIERSIHWDIPSQLTGRTFECDCVWRDARVVAELDGRASHEPAVAFERDRSRDRALSPHGWHVVRVTWHQLMDEPELVAADLRRLLGDIRHDGLDFAARG